jgi:hypothetical protein
VGFFQLLKGPYFKAASLFYVENLFIFVCAMSSAVGCVLGQSREGLLGFG